MIKIKSKIKIKKGALARGSSIRALFSGFRWGLRMKLGEGERETAKFPAPLPFGWEASRICVRSNKSSAEDVVRDGGRSDPGFRRVGRPRRRPDRIGTGGSTFPPPRAIAESVSEVGNLVDSLRVP